MSNRPIRIIQITDTHLHAHRDAKMRGLNTYESFNAVIEHIKSGQQQPDAIIATGDLVQDETRQGYERFCALTGELGVPVHCIPGNHDSPRIMTELLDQPPYRFCGSNTYGNWCLIMLNTVVRLDEGGRLDSDQLEILASSLTANSNLHALVAMHHHPMPMGSRWLDRINLRNSDDFFAIIDRHTNVRGIVWGHVHQSSDRQRNGVRMLSTPSTGAQFLPNNDEFMLDTRPPGYRWLNLMPDGSIETEVVWLA